MLIDNRPKGERSPTNDFRTTPKQTEMNNVLDTASNEHTTVVFGHQRNRQ
jgi:hypothetical protein